MLVVPVFFASGVTGLEKRTCIWLLVQEESTRRDDMPHCHHIIRVRAFEHPKSESLSVNESCETSTLEIRSRIYNPLV